jgi:hypothetical protein
MLDRAACADMVIGAPRAELAALVSCTISSSSAVSGEAPCAMPESSRRSKMSTLPKLVSTTVPAPAAVPRQLCIMFDSIRLQGMNASERTKVIACLANLLLLALGAQR